MSYPTDPLSVQVRARVLTVLDNIVAEDGYFSTPGVVYDNYKNWKEREAFPSYEVIFGAGGSWEEQMGDYASETFTLVVHGSIAADEDPPSMIRKLIRDVRKAVLNDATLLALVSRITLGETRTDNGAGALVGGGWFDQDFLCTIHGQIEEL